MKHSTRTALLTIIALTLALGLLAVPGRQGTANSRVINAPAQVTERRSDYASPSATPCPRGADAATALKCLEDGNKRWQETDPCRAGGCSGQTQMMPRDWGKERRDTADGQKPFAVVLSCMDSRVPPELIFDQGLGDIFVIRVAGPVLGPDELASLEYAIVEKHVALVVVLGHTNCGAVEAAAARPPRASGTYLPELLDKIEPAVIWVSEKYKVPLPIPKEDQTNLSRVSSANAKIVSDEILSKPALKPAGVDVTWGLYYVKCGKVAFKPGDVVPDPCPTPKSRRRR
jgi:carbonic anhydrase